MPNDYRYPITSTSDIGGIRYTRDEALRRLRNSQLSEGLRMEAARAIARRFGGTTEEAMIELLGIA